MNIIANIAHAQEINSILKEIRVLKGKISKVLKSNDIEIEWFKKADIIEKYTATELDFYLKDALILRGLEKADNKTEYKNELISKYHLNDFKDYNRIIVEIEDYIEKLNIFLKTEKATLSNIDKIDNIRYYTYEGNKINTILDKYIEVMDMIRPFNKYATKEITEIPLYIRYFFIQGFNFIGYEKNTKEIELYSDANQDWIFV